MCLFQNLIALSVQCAALNNDEEKVTKLSPSVRPSSSVDTCVELPYLSLQSLFSQAQAQNIDRTPVNSHVYITGHKVQRSDRQSCLFTQLYMSLSTVGVVNFSCPLKTNPLHESYSLKCGLFSVIAHQSSFFFPSGPTLQQVNQVEVVTFQDPRKKIKTKETAAPVNVSVSPQDILCVDF